MFPLAFARFTGSAQCASRDKKPLQGARRATPIRLVPTGRTMRPARPLEIQRSDRKRGVIRRKRVGDAVISNAGEKLRFRQL
jgi:hypothetical protein